MVSTPAGEPSQPATSARGDTDITQAPASRGQNMTSKVRKEQNKNASRVYSWFLPFLQVRILETDGTI